MPVKLMLSVVLTANCTDIKANAKCEYHLSPICIDCGGREFKVGQTRVRA